MIETQIKQYLSSNGFGTFSPKAVLFDMDGVLYDSMPNHAVAWQESMKKFGIHFTTADAYATEGARGVDTIRQFVQEQQGVTSPWRKHNVCMTKRVASFTKCPKRLSLTVSSP